MTKPKHRDESTCRHCGETIRLIGRIWKHWPGPRLPSGEVALHLAEPEPLHLPEPVKKRKGKR